LAVVAGVVVLLFEYVWIKPTFEPSLGTVAPTPMTTPEVSGTTASDGCRAPADGLDAPVDIATCIARAEDQLEITAHLVSRAPAAVTVHVWLREIGAGKPLEYTLKACRLTFTAAGQSQQCGPYLVRPDRPGHYRAATSAQTGIADLPRAWRDDGFTGLLSGVALSWP
jgi:hypothetical protein